MSFGDWLKEVAAEAFVVEEKRSQIRRGRSGKGYATERDTKAERIQNRQGPFRSTTVNGKTRRSW